MSARALASAALLALLCVGCTPASERPARDGDASAELADEQLEQITLAGDKLHLGQPEDALALVEPVIRHFEAKHPPHPARRLYSARYMPQTLHYLLIGPLTGKEITVLDSTWADAYLMKGYALVEMQRLDEARAALDQALALSPEEPHYLSELGYVLQAMKRFEESLAHYQHAERASSMVQPDENRKVELGRALRGQGYSLSELSRWDEAEKVYLRCLELDAKDQAARRELEYVRANRK